MEKCFLVTPPGIEKYLFQEISALRKQGFQFDQPRQAEPEYETNLEGLYALNLFIRTANRVLVRLGEFHVASFAELVRKAGKLPWNNYLQPGIKVKIRTTCKKSKLYHSTAVGERVLSVIQNQIGGVNEVKGKADDDLGEDEQLIVVRITNDICQISLDSSGAPLHKRGYRQAVAKAPLRENLAAAMVLASGWQPIEPLLDPFCGSGTIPIEAAMIAQQIAPGKSRNFSFMNWKNFHKEIWEGLLDRNRYSFGAAPFRIIGSDRNLGAIHAAQINSQHIGFSNQIDWVQQAFSAIEPLDATGWIITNPPYGVRVKSNKDLRNLYAQLGNVLHERFQGWQILFLCNDAALVGQTKLNVEPKMSFSNGGISVTAFYARI